MIIHWRAILTRKETPVQQYQLVCSFAMGWHIFYPKLLSRQLIINLWQPPDGFPCGAELSEAGPDFASKPYIGGSDLTLCQNQAADCCCCWENWHRTRSWWRANVCTRERSNWHTATDNTIQWIVFIAHTCTSSVTPILLPLVVALHYSPGPRERVDSCFQYFICALVAH